MRGAFKLARQVVSEYDLAHGAGAALEQALGFLAIVFFLAIDAWAIAAIFGAVT